VKRFLLCMALLLIAGGAAYPSSSVDVAVGVRVNENTRIFLNVTNQTWRPPIAPAIVQRCAVPEDDFPVVAFLAFHSHVSPSYILRLREDGYGWGDIFYRLHVSPGVLFVGIDQDPGPPYGRAWGNWRGNRRYGAYPRYRLSDRDVVALVKIQTAARHFGVTPYEVIVAQHGGRGVEDYTADRWRERNGRQTWDRYPDRDRGRRGRWNGDAGQDRHRRQQDRDGYHNDGGDGRD
jgi:hypothetical protein